MRIETIGDCTLYLGDCLEILPTLGKVDAVVTDPPYSISVAGAVHHGTKGKGSRRLDFFAGDSDWAGQRQQWLSALQRSIALNPTSVYAWVGHRQFGDTIDALEGSGFATRFLVWKKACPAPPPPGAGWPSGAELCVFGWRSGRTWNHTGSYQPPNNVITADSFRFGQPGKVDHPTQKPLAVVLPLLLASTAEKQTVLDPYLGSGTTGVACVKLGRHFIGIEIDPGYFEIACQRIRDAYAQGDLFRQPPKRKAEQTSLGLDSEE